MKAVFGFLLIAVLQGSSGAQTTTGNATTSGVCSPATTGSNNRYFITCNGVGKAQGEKIITLLNRVLANQDLTEVNAKLDELLEIASKPTQTQNCNGSNCVQGTNYAPLTYNQFGAPKLLMTEDQQKAITDAMKPYAGLKFTIIRHDATPDSSLFGDRLRDALKAAGLICTMDFTGTEGIAGRGIPPGVSIIIGKNVIPAVTALANTMKAENLLQAPLPATMNNTNLDTFDITVAPNR